MITYSTDEFVDLLERTILGKDIGIGWDDMLLAVKRGDRFTKYWAKRISAVEKLYPPERAIELFSSGGIKYLEEILLELKNGNES